MLINVNYGSKESMLEKCMLRGKSLFAQCQKKQFVEVDFLPTVLLNNCDGIITLIR